WKDELNPIQIQEVSSYIATLQGTNPANQKAPQGELYEGAQDSIESLDTPAADSTQVSMLN
ncbi:MAG: cytochrome C oxidase subunit III, partial [Flavobacteriales bacterium]|nr:cytochrome C oxidase subunit III [Flavobacteriales bacterium]